jgi:hypothetical protein
MTSRVILRILPILLFWPAVTIACTCSKAPPGVCPGLQSDDVVFIGTVTDVENVPPAAAVDAQSPDSAPDSAPAPAPASDAIPITRYHFKINEKFAGPNSPEIDVFSGGDDGDCGYHFHKGDQYIVFTQQETEGRLFATICSDTRPAADGRALIPQLRAMRNHQQIASVFGVLRRSDPPLLTPADDPDDPLPHIKLKLRSKFDRFATSTGPDGVYSFYDVHSGEYHFSASLPARMELSERTLPGALPPFKIPNGACYEYNVDALPLGKIRGAVLGPEGKPLKVASVELYRAEKYKDSEPGLWGFQGTKGEFEFDHVGPGDYILVFNRANRKDPNSPFPRAFYPGVANQSESNVITLKDGEQLLKANIQLDDGYPIRKIRVQLKWQDGRPPGEVTIMAKADQGENPAAQKIGEGIYDFTLLQSSHYTISAWEDLDPQHLSQRRGKETCTIPARIDADSASVDGADTETNEATLTFPSTACDKQ